MFTDAALRYFTDHQLEHDKDAIWARQDVDQEVVNRFLDNHPYINHALAKTTGRKNFNSRGAQALID